ncbi:hypothetical protein BBC0122_016430 [Bartonella choladocola]|uniref:Purine nucleoside phosphorylase n=2 Tax=Bartonella choladocola TaxID=2750995 RepID=A0A1U9MIL7_9HYPH|nr:hypothetical protein BBC0122_016430 [Bartonella choladocola]
MVVHMSQLPSPVFSPSLENLEKNGIRHAFFTRQGGVSRGIYESLNLGRGSDDDKENIDKNRDIVAAYMGVKPDNLINLYQIHSPHALIVNEPIIGERPRSDALVTNKAGLALGILTADCGPVLFADAKARVIGAAHAGWRGALAGVIENTVAAMETLGAKRNNIVATLGPCIGPKHYEVGKEFYETFVEENKSYEKFFTKSGRFGHFFFNLWDFIQNRLDDAGVHGDCVNLCTYGDEKRFFSYRRKTHRNEPDYGRQISVITLAI